MIETERLLIREWRDDDIDAFAAINADPLVMATLGAPLSRAQTAALIKSERDEQMRNGHCFWAVQRKSDARLIGWCGVIRGTAGPVAGKLELGWRLTSDVWAQGFAIEGARAVLDWCLANRPDEAQFWAITSEGNSRSRRVMERLGMTHDPHLDFDHPRVPDGSLLKRHVAYSIARP